LKSNCNKELYFQSNYLKIWANITKLIYIIS